MALDSILSTPVVSPPPKPVSSHSPSSSSSQSSFGADGASDSSSTQSSSSSNSSNTSDNGNATRNSGQNASSRNNAASNQGQNSASQAQKASSSSQSQQSTAANQAQSANATSNGKTSTAQSNTPGSSFLQALAQSQADAQDSAGVSTGGTPQVATGKGKGKAKDDGSTNSAASLGFLSQSLVAAMAGIQQTGPTQGTADGDSVDGVSLSSGTTAQTLTADLMQNTADSLKAAGDDGSTPSNSGTAGATDTNGANAAAASTFQAHLGVSSQSQAQATQSAANTQINTPVGSSGFADEVGDKITWMAHQGVQSASLQLTPEHMGPVEVKISVQNGSAAVSINAAHADTRAALEQALPRLREMFSTQGMNLTDASVSQQFSRGQAQKQGIKAVGSVGSVSDETSSPVVSVTSARLGLVDTYA